MIDYKDTSKQWPDGGRIYMDFRQVNIPKYSGSPVFQELPILPDYIVNGGNGIAAIDYIDGGNGITDPGFFDGGDGLG